MDIYTLIRAALLTAAFWLGVRHGRAKFRTQQAYYDHLLRQAAEELARVLTIVREQQDTIDLLTSTASTTSTTTPTHPTHQRSVSCASATRR